MTTPFGSQSCFTDFALEEFLSGRLSADVRFELEAHIASCSDCRTALDLLAKDRILLNRGLAEAARTPRTSESDTEQLGAYLSGGLSPNEREAVERRLSVEPELLADLIRLHDEAVATLSEIDRPGVTAQPMTPAGEILRMPKRTVLPVTVVDRNWEMREGSGG